MHRSLPLCLIYQLWPVCHTVPGHWHLLGPPLLTLRVPTGGQHSDGPSDAHFSWVHTDSAHHCCHLVSKKCTEIDRRGKSREGEVTLDCISARRFQADPCMGHQLTGYHPVALLMLHGTQTHLPPWAKYNINLQSGPSHIPLWKPVRDSQEKSFKINYETTRKTATAYIWNCHFEVT